KKEGAPNGSPFQSLRSQALSPRIGAKPETPNPQRRALRALSRRGLGNLRHGRGESASISAVDRQAVLRRADHRLRGALVGDVAVVDRLEHVGVVFVRHHVNLGIDVESLDGAALIGDLLVGEACGKTATLDDRRIVLALGDMIYRQ